MCGIVGIFDSRGAREIDRALLGRMTDRLAHRGPDGNGYHFAPGLGLGHRRLSIIDIAGGIQPMFNEDDTVCVIYNGEMYNYREVWRELVSRGHRFRSDHSDTEVIVHGWEEWGEACVERLSGQFAFAVWDARKETLFLARDRLGEKPLYYTILDDGQVVFGSELKALLLHPAVPRTIDLQAVEEYFAYGYVPDPRSIYRGIAKLPPAHYLTLRRGQNATAPRPYWNVSFKTQGGRNERDIGAELVDRLRGAVKAQMVADVPLGAFLSGGVDSSAVVSMMAGVSAESVNTFSIAFGHRNFDESRFAAAMAERYKTKHHVRQVDPDEFDLIDRLATIYDEPFGDSSALPTFRVCAMAREKVTVALSGDGGDEMFAGYRRYRWHHYEERVRAMLPAAIRGPLFGALARLYPKFDWLPRPLRAKTTLQELALDAVDGYFSSISVINDELRRQLYSPRLTRELQGYHARELLLRHLREADTDDPMSQAQYVDIKTYLSGDILAKVDRAAMASSLEVRVPILDHSFVEWVAALPPAMKLRGKEGKYIFKRALEPHVSSDILYRPKQGFSVPLVAWFRGPLRERVRRALSSPLLADSGLFDMAFLGQLVDQHQSGLRDHSAVLWLALSFEAFLRQVHEGDSAAMPRAAPAVAAVG
ncbi:MAG: amidotransferase 1, exosortase A system-associated [Proteobacteria bacterium]|nr:amidotransferase 1, exosortase A system-associated [Pseudomonadota bacterium]